MLSRQARSEKVVLEQVEASQTIRFSRTTTRDTTIRRLIATPTAMAHSSVVSPCSLPTTPKTRELQGIRVRRRPPIATSHQARYGKTANWCAMRPQRAASSGRARSSHSQTSSLSRQMPTKSRRQARMSHPV